MSRDDMTLAVETERRLLSSMMLSGQVADRVAPELDGVDWCGAGHSRLWQAIQDVRRRQEQPDAIALLDTLGPDADDCGGVDYLMRLEAMCESAYGVEQRARLVASLSQKRAVVHALRTAAAAVDEADSASWATTAAGVPAEIARALANGRSQVTAQQALATYIERMRTVELGGGPPGLYTGFNKLDRLTAGLRPGQLIFTCSRPAVGKSAFAYNIAARVVTGRNGMSPSRVVIWSGELPPDEVAGRILLAHARGVRAEAVQRCSPSQAEIDMLLESERRLKQAPLHILTDQDASTMGALAGALLQIQALHGPIGLVIIDQATQIKPMAQGRHVDRFQGIRECAMEGKPLAKRLGCPVLALNQVNRKAEERPNGVPTKHDIWGADDVEQWSDIVILPWRNRVRKPSGDPVFRLHVVKHRQGRTEVIELEDRLEYGCFDD